MRGLGGVTSSGISSASSGAKNVSFVRLAPIFAVIGSRQTLAAQSTPSFKALRGAESSNSSHSSRNKRKQKINKKIHTHTVRFYYVADFFIFFFKLITLICSFVSM